MNMSYCRFENTSIALQECYDDMELDEEGASEYEIKGRERLIKLCCLIAEQYADELGEMK